MVAIKLYNVMKLNNYEYKTAETLSSSKKSTFMNKSEIILNLKKNYSNFINYINSLDEEKYEYSDNTKWNAGQEIDHISKSTKPIANILLNKNFIINKFGQHDQNSYSYDEIVSKYQDKLKEGGKATGNFSPELVPFSKKVFALEELEFDINEISLTLNNYNEIELDNLQLPHPLLGLLSIREMLYFTIYHVLHHIENSKKNLK